MIGAAGVLGSPFSFRHILIIGLAVRLAAAVFARGYGTGCSAD